MKAKRVWTVCLAVLTLLALLAGCGKQAQVQSDPSPEPDPEPALFDGSFDLVLKSAAPSGWCWTAPAAW